jgi:hypothetical protein
LSIKDAVELNWRAPAVRAAVRVALVKEFMMSATGEENLGMDSEAHIS